ncbi:hypothetical protein [Bacteroides sp. UBA939]|uniref:hypothetical protein n=1 Tax=Bacteroides sp. UBA939 TaxID=1946092 RepID=UPI0025C135CA|nr:hypothetical protein [Bacteroides sp. UBA939]
MKTTILSYLTLLLLILAGCEAPIHDNFVDIEKPDEIPLGINLNAFTQGENIIVYKANTRIYYTFETGGRQILKAEFTLGDMRWETWGESGEIWLSVYELPKGSYTLTCNLYVATNSGSVADQVGMEAYGGTMSWKVTVDYENDFTESKEMITRINEEGYLELTWEKPNYKYMDFLNYTVYKGGMLLATIEDADITSFVDKSHVLDFGEGYSVQAHFEDNNTWHIGHKYLPYDEINIEQVEEISAIDSCTVRWSKGKDYKCKWNVYVNDELKLSATEETSIRIPLCAFGTTWSALHRIRVEVVAYDESYRNSYPHSQYVTAGAMGKFLGDNHMRFNYNESESTLYYSVYGEVNSISVPDLTLIAKHNGVPSASITSAISSSEKNGKILVSYYDVLALYEGKMLPTPLTHSISSYFVNVQKARILNDDRVFYLERTYLGDMIACILSTDMKPEKRVVLQGAEVYSSYGVISADGKYLCLNNSEEIAIYKMSSEFEILEKKVHPINELTENNIRFIPHDSSRILVAKANTNAEATITIYNTEDMTPIHSYKALHVGVDPKTGYLCLTQRNRIEIIDIDNDETLFTLPIERYQGASLLGGILISDNGYAMNINPYLEKNKL